MILEPSSGSLFSNSLRPPLGYEMGGCIGTTFSCDLQLLLDLPEQLMRWKADEQAKDEGDRFATLAALENLQDRFLIFCQSGRVSVPARSSLLYGLLDSCIVEAVSRAKGGAFHPKVWAMHFRSPMGADRMRLLVMSRNATFDTSWDLCLCLEGDVGSDERASNRQLADFFRILPEFADAQASRKRELRERCEPMAGLLAKTTWEIEAPFDDVKFFGHYRGGEAWEAPAMDSLAVLSPFCSSGALKDLAAQVKTRGTGRRKILVSREATLLELPSDVLDILAHPGIVWLESCGPRSGGRVKVQTAAMEVDRVAEA